MIVGIIAGLGLIFIFRCIVTVWSQEKRRNVKTWEDLNNLHHWEDRRMAILVLFMITVSVIMLLIYGELPFKWS